MKIRTIETYAWLANAAYVHWSPVAIGAHADANAAIFDADQAERIPGNVTDSGIDTLGEKIFKQEAWKIEDYFQNDPDTGFSASLFTHGNSNEKILAIRGTEPVEDTYRDLLEADLLQIGFVGMALSQAVSLVNYVNRLRADSTERQVMRLELKVTTAFDSPPPPTTPQIAAAPDVIFSLEAHYDAAGLGLVHETDRLSVTGHSLGGHLAALAIRLFPDVFTNAVTFNAAGFDPLTADYVASLLASLPPSPASVIAPLLEFATRQLTDEIIDGLFAPYLSVFRAPASSFAALASRMASYGSEDALPENDPDVLRGTVTGTPATPRTTIVTERDSHLMEPLMDALAVQSLLERLDPEIGLTGAARLLQVASSQTGASDESLLDSLARLLLHDANRLPRNDIGLNPLTSTGDFAARTALHQRIITLEQSLPLWPGLRLRSLDGMRTEDLVANAEQSPAYRYALRELNPFVLVGNDAVYAAHNTRGELALENFSAQYLADRALFLGLQLEAARQDRSLLFLAPVGDTQFVDKTHEIVLRTDADTVHDTFPPALRAVFGTPLADGPEVFTGAQTSAHLYGGDGGDTLAGAWGDDYLEGDTGDDVLIGGKGRDELDGGPGADTLWGGASEEADDARPDVLHGGTGADTYYAGHADAVEDSDRAANISLVTPELTRALAGSWQRLADDVYVRPEPGLSLHLDADTAVVVMRQTSGLTAIRIDSFKAQDAPFSNGDFGITLSASEPDQTRDLWPVNGSPADDRMLNTRELNGTQGNDQIDGMAGDDDLFGGRASDPFGQDVLRGGSGNDYLSSATVLDTDGVRQFRADQGDFLDGGANDDILIGAGGGDELAGGAGRDFLAGRQGADLLDGGAGNDYLSGGDGADVLIGGDGDDDLFGGFDVVASADRSWQAARIHEGGRIVGVTITGHLPASIHAAAADSDLLFGGAGDDFINGEAGDDIAYGDGDDDVLFGGGGDDFLDGGDGADVLYGDTFLLFPGDSGDDELHGGAGQDELQGERGADSLYGEGDDDRLYGGDGRDALYGGADDDMLDGGEDHDRLFGGDGDDTLTGGAGADRLAGERGDDRMRGGAGNDLYYYSYGDGHDLIEDDSGFDQVVLWGVDLKQARFTHSGDDLILGFNPHDSLTLKNWSLGAIESVLGAAPNQSLGGGALSLDSIGVLRFDVADNSISGSAGDDVIALDAMTTHVFGGAGNDLYVLQPATTAAAGVARSTVAGGTVIRIEDIAGHDSLWLPEDAVPSDLNGVVRGTVITLTLGENRLELHTGALERYVFAHETISGSELETRLWHAPELAMPLAPQRLPLGEPLVRAIPSATFVDRDVGDALQLAVTLDDGQPLPDWLHFDPDTRTLSGTAAAEMRGALTLTVTATDTRGETIATPWLLWLGVDNSPPRLQHGIAAQRINEDAALMLTLPADAFMDPDASAPLTYTLRRAGGAPLPQWLQFDAARLALQGWPTNDDVGELALELTAYDVEGAATATTFSLTVVNVNDPPQRGVELSPQSLSEDSPFSFTIPAAAIIDVDVGDTLRFAVARADGSELPTWLQFDTATNTLFGQPGNDDVGLLPLALVATDGSGASVTAPLEFAVRNVNDAPIVNAAPVARQITAGQTFEYTLPATTFRDVDVGDQLVVSASLDQAWPDWLSFDVAAQRFSGTPGNDDTGDYELVLIARDDSGASAATHLPLRVVASNQSPVLHAAMPDRVAAVGQPFRFALPGAMFSDPNRDDALQFTLQRAEGEAAPAWLALAVAGGGTLSGLPPPAAQGELALAITATDSGGLAARTVFTLTVNAGTGTTPVPWGVETAVTPAVSTLQRQPAVLALPAHEYLVAWSGEGIQAQRFDRFGEPLGPVLQLVAAGANPASEPALTSTSEGGVLLVWTALAGADGDGAGVFGQRFDAQGLPLATPFRINTFTPRDQRRPAATTLMEGDVIIAWESSGQDGSDAGVYAQRLAAGAQRLSAEFRVNDTTLRTQGRPRLASLLDGGFIVAWEADGQDGSGAGVYARRYAASGDALTDEFRVNTTTRSNQSGPAVAALADGGAVVVWTAAEQEGSDNDVYLQRYDAAGWPLGPETAVNSTTFSNQQNAVVTALADGGYIVAWESNPQEGGDYGLYGQRFAADGMRLGTEFLLDTYREGNQLAPALAAFADGGFVVAWDTRAWHPNGSIATQRFKGYAEPNHAPAVAAGFAPVHAHEDVPFDFRIPLEAFADSDPGDGLRFSARMSGGGDLPEWLAFDPGAGRLAGTPGNAEVGEYLLAVTAIDGVGASVDTTLRLTVDNTNDVPVLATPLADRLLEAGRSTTLELAPSMFTDNDLGDTLHWTVSLASGAPLPEWLQFDAADRRLRAAPSARDLGSHALAVTVQDDAGAITQEMFALQVTSMVGTPLANGGEERINRESQGNQTVPAVATLGSGETVVVWRADAALIAQRYTANGAPAALPLLIGGSASGKGLPAISAMANGGFVVVWSYSGGVRGQRFDAQAQPLGGEFEVFASPRGASGVSVAALASDGFVVTWASSDLTHPSVILSRRYDGQGASVGASFYVPTLSATPRWDPALATLRDGGWVVTWLENTDIYALRVDASGAQLSTPLRVNRHTADFQSNPHVAGLSNGGFVTVWQSLGQDGSDDGVFARRYNAAGLPEGDEFQVNLDTLGAQRGVTVTALADGGFVIAWQSPGADGASDLLAQRYDALAQPIGSNFSLNSHAAGEQQAVTISALAAGGFVAVWQSALQDGDRNGIYAQRFAAEGRPNRPPTLGVALAATVASEDAPFMLALPENTFTDQDPGDVLRYTATRGDGSELPGWLNFDPGQRRFVGTPGNTEVGALAVRVTATDAYGATASGSFTLTVTDINDAPVVSQPLADQLVRAGTAINFLVPTETFFDRDESDSLYYRARLADGGPLPGWLQFTPATGVFGGVVNLLEVDPASVLELTVTATDRGGLSASGSFRLRIEAPGAVIGDNAGNSLSGGGLDDVLLGLAGDDSLSGGAGADLLNGGDGADTLRGEAGNDRLAGGQGADRLFGGDGTDTLYGGAGADALDGGNGPDTYWVDDIDDRIVEQAGSGHDVVFSAISWRLGANLEALYLTGTQASNGSGNAAANTLGGNNADNILDGGGGKDVLFGNYGSDTYLFGRDSGYDFIREEVSAATKSDIDSVRFGAAIAPRDLWFSRSGKDLRIAVLGANATLVSAAWYAQPTRPLERFELDDGAFLLARDVDQLVQAMAIFTIPPAAGSAQTAAVTEQLESVLAAVWQAAA